MTSKSYDLLQPLPKRDVETINNRLKYACERLSDEKTFERANDAHDMIVDHFVCGYDTSKRNHPINFALRNMVNVDMDKFCKSNPDTCKEINREAKNMCNNRTDLRKVRDLTCRLKFQSSCENDDACAAKWWSTRNDMWTDFLSEREACRSDKVSPDFPFQRNMVRTHCSRTGKARDFGETFMRQHTNATIDDVYNAIPWARQNTDMYCDSKPNCLMHAKF